LNKVSKDSDSNLVSNENMSEFLPSSAGFGNLRAGSGYRPTKQNHPARSPFTNCINVTAHL